MRNITIIEIDYHPDLLRNLYLLLNSSTDYISIYTTEKIWRQTGLLQEGFQPAFRLFVKKEEELTSSFFHKHLQEINRSDFIFFDTLASHFRLFYNLKLKPPVVLRIHNANTYFRPANSFAPFQKRHYLFKDISHILRKSIGELEAYYRKKFLSQCRYFMFPNETITQYVTHRGWVDTNRVVMKPIPMAFFDEKNYRMYVDRPFVHITVIGSIDRKRRDYDLLYNAIKSALPECKHPIKFTILGGAFNAYGRKVVQQFLSLSGSGFEFEYFKSFVAQDTFNQVLFDTDFLICPIRLATRYTIHTEQYGLTKISGCEGDLIRYGKPAILPEEYPVQPELQPIIAQYKDKDTLTQQLIDWINTAPYRTCNIPEILSPYRLENVREQWEQFADQFKTGIL